MKKSLFLLLAMFALAVFVSTGFTVEKKAVKKAVEKIYTMKGKVASVDTAAGTLTLPGKKGDIVFATDANTQVKIGKEAKSLADIKAGDVVTIKYKNADGKKLALTIQVPAPATEKKK